MSVDDAITAAVERALSAALDRADLGGHGWDELLSARDAAERLAISESKLNDLIADGVLPWVQVGRHRKLRASDLQAFIDSNVQRHRHLGVAS